MASKTEVLVDQPGCIVVRVVHLDTDSFSRSVDRAANKARRASRNANSATFVKGDYAFMNAEHLREGTYGPRECVSMVVYSTSFATAQALVDTYVGLDACDGEHGSCPQCGEESCTVSGNGSDCSLPRVYEVMSYRATLETPAEYEGVCTSCCPDEDA